MHIQYAQNFIKYLCSRTKLLEICINIKYVLVKINNFKRKTF